MPSPLRRLTDRLPLQFRVLYKQFLLRVIDLEALSIEADVPRFLGQFAGVLILISVLRAIGLLFVAGRPHITAADLQTLVWTAQQNFLSMTMLVAGLIAVVSWDNIFPDRRDVMVLGPLPVRPRTILLARMAASATVLSIAALALNFAISVAVSLIIGGIPAFPKNFAAYWISIIAAAVFIYGSVLALQGSMALLLPRRIFLRLSAIAQLAAFAWFLSNFFLEPAAGSPVTTAAAAAHGSLNLWPSFWFLALMNQLSGHLPPALHPLASRAWIALAAVVTAATLSLLLCYLRTMKKTVEEADLVPARSGHRWTPHLGDSLRTAVVSFTLRSLSRSRQHRVVYAFFLSVTFAIAISTVKDILANPTRRPITTDFLMPTLVMMCLAIVGLRSIFSLPVSLHANWVLQITQLRPSENYIAATRRALLLMAALPIWIVVALLSLGFRPWPQVVAHLAVLALIASILTDLSLIGISKIPFACSYLPGTSNIQYMFWAFAVVFLPIAIEFANYEQRAIQHPGTCIIMMAILAAAATGIWAFNRQKAKSALLYYEELPPVIITTLGLHTAPLRATIEISAPPKPQIHP
jgi:hypothetical protein